MRLTSVVLTSWISSITSKNQLNSRLASIKSCVCLCVSVHLCLSVIDSTNWYMGRKNKYWKFFCLEIWILAWRSHGKIMEFFLWEPCNVAWQFWNHYMYQCWLIINVVLWHLNPISHEMIGKMSLINHVLWYSWKIISASLRVQRVNHVQLW